MDVRFEWFCFFFFFFAFIAFPLSVCVSFFFFFFSIPFSVDPFAYTHSVQVVLSFTCTACGSISVVCWCSLCSSQVLWVRMRFRASFCNIPVFFFFFTLAFMFPRHQPCLFLMSWSTNFAERHLKYTLSDSLFLHVWLFCWCAYFSYLIFSSSFFTVLFNRDSLPVFLLLLWFAF